MDKYKKRTVKPNTVRNYTERYHRNIEPIIGEKLLSSVNTIHCQTIMNKMVKSDVGQPSDKKQALTIEQQKEFCKIIEGAAYEYQYRFLLQTGLRTGEMVKMVRR